MYSVIKNIQILIALLKEYGIRHLVVSPGGSSIPIIHTLEVDDYFKLYSVVDERSAAYFAMGISQKLKEPVGLVSTSGTAACNYLPAVTEAFYQNVPLVVITGDKQQYATYQLAIQKIKQDNLYQDVCRKSVTVPPIDTWDDNVYAQRIINEALLELDHHGTGPVHINIHVTGNVHEYTAKSLPKVKKIGRLLQTDAAERWIEKIDLLRQYKRILVVCGQHLPFEQSEIRCIEEFAEKYNCVLAVEHMSNVKCKHSVLAYRFTEMCSAATFDECLPDLVISFGGNVITYKFLERMLYAKNWRKFDHWLIDESGAVKDVFNNLTDIFECDPLYFFNFFTEHSAEDWHNDEKYFKVWMDHMDALAIPDFPFSNIWAVREFSKLIPENSLLHLAILNSLRYMQFSELSPSVEVYSNIGALGIDGCMSSFIGQSVATDQLCFLVIGDLSFFYDMNALWIKYLGRNVRIMLLNNAGAEEFYLSWRETPNIDDYVAVRNRASAKGWCESRGLKYLSASSEEEYRSAIDTFVSPESDAPVILEIFTDMASDSDVTLEMYKMNNIDSIKDKGKSFVKNIARGILGENADKAAEIAKLILNK